MQSLRTPRFFGSTPLLGLAALAVLGLAAVLRAAQTQDSIIFGRFAAGGARSSARFLSPASSGSRTSNGVPFWTNAFALGDQFAVENGVPLVTPRSGRHAFAANNTLTTLPPATKTLHGLYLGKIDGPPAAAHVIVNALGPYNPATGTYTVISSTAADALSGTTLSFFNTGAPAVSTKRTGFSGCSLISQSAPAAFGNFDFAGDHSAFSVPAGSSPASAAPEPSALAVWALVGAGLVLRAKKRKATSV